MINWDKAPDGATHWHKDHGWIKNDYYNVTNYNGFMWENGILANVLSTAIKRPKAAIPKQEDKEMQDWLKAGNKIEINTDDGEWSEEEILLIKEIRGINSITITTSYSDEELAETFDLDYYLEHDLIRPVKTEKEKWIDDAINVIEDYYAVHVNKHTHKLDVSEAKRQLGAIYDAGLAKYEYR